MVDPRCLNFDAQKILYGAEIFPEQQNIKSCINFCSCFSAAINLRGEKKSLTKKYID